MWTLKYYILVLLATFSLMSCNQTELVILKAGQRWQCNFRRTDNCGIVNQSLMPSNFTFLPEGELQGEVGLYYLGTSTCSRNGARMMTPYFRWGTHVRTVCLSIKYIIFGKGIRQLSLLKQDRKNSHLWSDLRSGTGKWQLVHINVTIYPSHPARFFIESRLRKRTGFLAISEIGIRDSFCIY